MTHRQSWQATPAVLRRTVRQMPSVTRRGADPGSDVQVRHPGAIQRLGMISQ